MGAALDRLRVAGGEPLGDRLEEGAGVEDQVGDLAAERRREGAQVVLSEDAAQQLLALRARGPADRRPGRGQGRRGGAGHLGDEVAEGAAQLLERQAIEAERRRPGGVAPTEARPARAEHPPVERRLPAQHLTIKAQHLGGVGIRREKLGRTSLALTERVGAGQSPVFSRAQSGWWSRAHRRVTVP